MRTDMDPAPAISSTGFEPTARAARPALWRRVSAFAVDILIPLAAATTVAAVVITSNNAFWITIVGGLLLAAITAFVLWNLRFRRREDGYSVGAAMASGTAPDADHRRGWVLGLGMLVVLAASLAGLTASQYISHYSPDRATGTAESDAAQIASDGTEALLSYAPDTAAETLAAAATHLTGDFLDYYTKYTTEVVIPTAQDKKVNTVAEAAGAAVTTADADSATVLVFINQTTTTSDNPEPAKLASTVRVQLTRTDGNWLISQFEPV